MKSENAIEIRNVTKSFTIKAPSGKDPSKVKMEKQEHVVLDHVTLDIKKGEVIGIIGRNGSGKSTLLKMISRIMEPDSGTIEINGKIASILELGMGFHPDMSGRENIYLKGATYGFTKKEINERIDDIIEYSNLGDYIENPIRTYSSGMTGRLAFAIMVNVDADIILVDEILSVGDASFSAKAKEHFRKMTKKGRTVVIVSHSFPSITEMCTKAVWIDNGKIREVGHPKVVCSHCQIEMTESFDITYELAESGVIEAQYRLACMYRDGNKTEQDDTKAAEWMREAAELGYTQAQADYADMLFNGIGVEPDQPSAIYFYQLAADHGNNDAKMKIASLASDKGDEDRKEILDMFRVLAEDGEPLYQFKYADLLLKTAWSNDDRKKALEWFTKAAEGEYPDAMYQTGLMYLNGIGTPRNANEAVKWFEKAGETWEPRSMITLADLYLDGTKIEKNEEIAFKWYLRSAEIGNQKAQFQIATMYRDGIGTEQNSEKSEIWFTRYSHSTLSAHQIFMADMLNKGIAVEWDYSQSVELFTKAAETGNLNSTFQLGLFYRDNLIKQDMRQAAECFKKAADLGHVPSQLNYADMLFRGLGIEQDFEEATTYYTLASKSRNITAFLRLAIIPTNNPTLSKKYLQISLKLGNKDALQFK